MLPYIDAPFAYVANLLGASTDELKLIASFLFSYPLAGLLKRVPDSKPWQKNAFTIAVSLFYLVGLFDLWDGLRTLAISSAGAYAIAKYIQGPLMPWVGFVFLMSHMSINHLDRQFRNEPEKVDITGAQMVLIMKLTAFCWNVHDGRLPDSELTDFQKERAVRELPSLLDYAGYVLFFPSLFAGPAFDYVDYRQWLTTTMFELPPGTDPSKAPPTRKKRKIPRSGTPATWKAIVGLVWIFSFLQFSSWYYPSLLLSSEYMQHNFLKRVWYLHMLGFATRMKYYGVWHLTEGACILSGIGYKGVDPKTGRVNWNRLQNVKPLGIELAQNTHAYLGNWNINTNLWLRNYMYLRVTPKGKKPGFRASMATFVTSAFWHGFYPGYYMSFVLASFLQTIAKNGRRLLRPFFLTPDGQTALPSKRYYDIFTWLVTQLAFSFTVAPFIFLTLPESLLVWRRVYFYCVLGVLASLAFLASPAKGILIKQLKQRAAQGKSAAPGVGAAPAKEKATGMTSAADIRSDNGDLPPLINRRAITLDTGHPGVTVDDLLEEKVLGSGLGVRPGLSRVGSDENIAGETYLGLPEDLEREVRTIVSNSAIRVPYSMSSISPATQRKTYNSGPLVASTSQNDQKAHLLLAASGSVATIKIPAIIDALSRHKNLSIRLVLTSSASAFLAGQAAEQPSLDAIAAMPNVDGIYLDEDEWVNPWTRGASILHIELRRWADIMVVAPLSANTLAKVVGGLCDNLLTSTIRAWDTTGLIDPVREHFTSTGDGVPQKKIIMLAPAMNTAMWHHPITNKQVGILEGEWNVKNGGWVEVLRPIEKTLACGDVGGGAMKEWKEIVVVIEHRMGLVSS